MENINKKFQKRQLYLLLIIVAVISVLGFLGFLYFTYDNNQNKKPVKETPQFVGVINQTFDEKYTTSVLKDNQSLAREIDRKYEVLQAQVKNKDSEISKIKSQLIEQEEKFKNTIIFYNQKFEDLERKQNDTKSYNIDIPNNIITNRANQATNVGSNYVPNQVKFISSMTLNQALTVTKSDLPYIPSGSFAEAIIIEGADANASVTGNNNTDPIQFRLTGKVQMPNDHEYDLTGCFITAEVYGDISSERGKVRTHSMSCKLNDKTIDMRIKGHVAFMGKNGIRGVPIMRNGQIIAWAGAAGFMEGLGKGAESAAGTTVGVGATANVSGGDILKSALGGGASTASKTLSDYYIKRAEQYHPIIEIGSGHSVTVMFQDGFQLEYIEEKNLSKTNNQNQDIIKNNSGNLNRNYYKNSASINSGLNSSSSTGLSSSTDSNISTSTNESDNNENEIEQLKNIYLDDFLK